MSANQESTAPKSAWTEVVAAKQRTRNEHVKKYLNTPVDSTLFSTITHLDDVDSLMLLLEKGEISAEEIVRAYISK
jgi:hypothetical protein